MCMCGRPTINGEPNAYSWDGKSHSTRQPSPPSLRDGDELLFDEPGRCGEVPTYWPDRLVEAPQPRGEV